jgi:antirestriction protein ArdC
LLDILLNRGAVQMATIFAFLLACDFRVCKFFELANATAENAYLREKMSEATAERLFALRESKGH